MFVIWRWTWIEGESSESEKSSDTDDCRETDGATIATSTKPDSSDSDDDISAITHSVVFKCIGCLKEYRYQEILAIVAKKIRQGETVPVKLQKEPDNPVDSRAVAFMCKLNDEYERIGYVVREALDSVHEAMDGNKILQLRFDWVKYIVHCREHGWYAGIVISRRGDWPQSVMQSRAKTFV